MEKSMEEVLELLRTVAKKEPQDRYTGEAWEAGCDDGEIFFARELLELFDEE